MLGLSGSHRTGKTSLARAYANKHKLEFVQTSASQVFKDFGMNPAERYSFDTRLMVQEEILKRFDAQYADSDPNAITDRTPLDMLAYTLADAVQDFVPDEVQERLARYIQACLDVTNKRFSTLLIVQPGIKVVAEEGKASLNNAYIEHLNSLILGLSVDERVKVPHFYVPRYMTDMEDRIAALEFAVSRSVRRAETERDGSVIH